MRVPVFILMITLLSTAIARADDPAAINKLIADINAAAKTNKARLLRIMVINTDVAASTLELEKSRDGNCIGTAFLRMGHQRNLVRSRHAQNVRNTCRRLDDIETAEHGSGEEIHSRVILEEEPGDVGPAHL